MTWSEYEQLVGELVQEIYKHVEGVTSEQIKVGKGRSNRLPGVSGQLHQIDVSVTGPQVLFLVECKYWNKSVPVEAVLTFFARIHDISPTFHDQTHGAIVTNVEFDKGVKKFAKYYNIDLCLVQSAHEFALKYKGLLRRALSVTIDTILV